MSTPAAPTLTATATSDATSYPAGATITIDAAALEALAVAAVISATIGSVSVNTEVDFTVEEPATGAVFGITDSTGGLISWTVAAGTEPGTAVLTGVAPSSLPASS